MSLGDKENTLLGYVTEVSFALSTSVRTCFTSMKEKGEMPEEKKYEDPGQNVREIVSEQPPTVVEI
ncbi:Uncharacterized protein DBV15_05942 [Temnothorax longispinosus]|uniref:Uncharacterized protein n=1 Tax=Temnothorax longispinosus TaxID=300112 RepID=A0A4V6RGI8_9HYME|nr:Uncharacterized protein DBV15_05942 [Temnothorax longispinosus]